MTFRAATDLPSPTSFISHGRPSRFARELNGSSSAALHLRSILNVSKKPITYQLKPPRVLTTNGTPPQGLCLVNSQDARLR